MPVDNFFTLVPGSGQTLASTAASSAIVNAFGPQTRFIRVIATAAVNIRIDSAPVAVTTDTALAANYPEVFCVNPGQKLAAIGVAGVNVTELS
jgi:hypothetical protein